MRKPVSLIVSMWLIIVACGVSFAASTPHIGEEEVKMGNEAAATAEKEHPPLQDAALNARVQSIGDALAAVANSLETEASYGNSAVTPFTYTFKVIDDKEVNAFSIPGGHIYVHKGLIDFCETDHELAAVLAHEIAHASHHHMVHLLREQSRLDGRMALLLVAGLLTDVRTEDMSNVMMGTQFYKTARVNGYGQKAESDADLTGITYMTRAGYNPVGMLTFLERLADHPDLIDWGILQTHPKAGDRARAVKDRLAGLGVEINRRIVTTSSTAVVRRIDVSGRAAFDIVVGSRPICRLSRETEAQNAAKRINALFDAGLQISELRASDAGVYARREAILEFTRDDIALSDKPAGQVAADAQRALRDILFGQLVHDLW